MVELGTHDELMALGGRYRTMFDLQAQRFGGGRRRADAMTSSPDAAPSSRCRRRLSSMWRLCKLGYRHEPRLMLAAFSLALLAALPDALLALWLKLARRGRAAGRLVPRPHGGHRAGALGHRDVAAA